MDDATRQAILSAIRSLLIIAGSSFAAHGVFNQDTANEGVGAIMVLIPVFWGIWDKFRAEQVAKAREAVAINVGIAVADATSGPTPLVTAADAPHVIASIAPTLPAGPTQTVVPEVQSTKGTT